MGKKSKKKSSPYGKKGETYTYKQHLALKKKAREKTDSWGK